MPAGGFLYEKLIKFGRQCARRDFWVANKNLTWPESPPPRAFGCFWANKIIILARRSTRRGLLVKQGCNLLPESRPAGAFFRKSTRMGLLDKQNHNFGQKICPQGTLGQTNSWPECRPAGAFLFGRTITLDAKSSRERSALINNF